MRFSTLDLGYTVRRAKLDDCEGLSVFAHDIDTFCIPIDQADRLARAYKRYLIAAGIIDETDNLSWEDDQRIDRDRHMMGFYHERVKTPFVRGEFHLGAVIDFVVFEAPTTLDIAVRWCMMMEYIIWNDQRLSDKEDEKFDVPPIDLGLDDKAEVA